MWKQATAVPGEAEFREARQVEHFIKALITNGYIGIDTKGYYGNPTKQDTFKYMMDAIVGMGAYNLAEFLKAPSYYKLPAEQKAKNLKLIQSWIKHPTQANFLAMRPNGQTMGNYDCWVTGKRITWHFDGKTMKASRYWDTEKRDYVPIEACPYPDGQLPISNFTIAIPSGRLALFQWINDDKLIKDLDYGERPSANSDAGRAEYSHYFEKNGFWHIYCGGSGRELFKKGDTYLIGRKHEEDASKPQWKGWRRLGEMSFDTDLRWFTACDANKLKPKHYKMDSVLVVNVSPGEYTLSDIFARKETPDGFMATFKKARH